MRMRTLGTPYPMVFTLAPFRCSDRYTASIWERAAPVILSCSVNPDKGKGDGEPNEWPTVVMLEVPYVFMAVLTAARTLSAVLTYQLAGAAV